MDRVEWVGLEEEDASRDRCRLQAGDSDEVPKYCPEVGREEQPEVVPLEYGFLADEVA